MVSNPTLSAILLKINRLAEILKPLSGLSFVFGMSHMQFCRAQLRAVKVKPTGKSIHTSRLPGTDRPRSVHWRFGVKRELPAMCALAGNAVFCAGSDSAKPDIGLEVGVWEWTSRDFGRPAGTFFRPKPRPPRACRGTSRSAALERRLTPGTPRAYLQQ